MGTKQEKIEKLRAQLRELEIQEKAQEARKKALLAKRVKAEDTRRKILLGAEDEVFWREVPGAREEKMARMDKYLIRDHDRALFSLPPLQSQSLQPLQPPTRHEEIAHGHE